MALLFTGKYQMKIKVSTDFSDTPGARYYEDGDFSGQEFYESILVKEFQKCIDSNSVLEIDLDDCYGFASSFLSESFGRLSEEFGNKVVLNNIKIISHDDPLLENQIVEIIHDPKKSKRNEK